MKAADLRPGNSVLGYRVQAIEVNDERGRVLVDVGVMVWVYRLGDEAEDLAYCVAEFVGGNPQPLPHVWETWPKHNLRPSSNLRYVQKAAEAANGLLTGTGRTVEVIALPWSMAALPPWYQ